MSFSHFIIEYKPGNTNSSADALSRVTKEDDVFQAAFMALSIPVLHLFKELCTECAVFPDLQTIIASLQGGTILQRFSLRDGILYYHGSYCIGEASKFKSLFLREFHETPIVGHFGVKMMMVRIVALF